MLQVLIVDDTASNRQLLEIVLGMESDVEVIGQSTDGLQAIEAASMLKPDLIVMDGQMPHLNGVDAMSVITVLHPEMLIIAYSSSDELGQEMGEAGAFAVVPKTGDMDELTQAIAVAKQAVFGRQMPVTPSL